MDGWMEAELMWWSLPFEWRGATTSRMCLESNSRGVALGGYSTKSPFSYSYLLVEEGHSIPRKIYYLFPRRIWQANF
jgi:hypothetical protein